MVAQRLNGINTQDQEAAIRGVIYTGKMRLALEPELIAMNYVDMITDFPDGEQWQDLELGNLTTRDYKEGETIVFDGLAIGTRLFEINYYKQCNTYATEKFLQDSYISGQITATLPSAQARAIYAEIEQSIFALHRQAQTPGDPNIIADMRHRFVAGYDDQAGFTRYGALQPLDFAYAATALKRAGYTGQLIAIVPTYQEYEIASNPRLQNSLSYNPKWEGIVADGVSSGMKFAFNIMGFDVYTSNYTDVVAAETLEDRAGNEVACVNAGVALMFINQPDRRPFRMAWRMMPKIEGQWNPYERKEDYICLARYGLGVGDTPNLVAVLCNEGSSTFTAV